MKWRRFPPGWTSSRKAAPKAPRLAQCELAVNRLWTNLKSLDRLVAERIVVSERKRDQLRNALDDPSRSQSLLTPWLQIVDGEIAQSRRAIGDAHSSRGTHHSRQPVVRFNRGLPRITARAVSHHIRE